MNKKSDPRQRPGIRLTALFMALVFTLTSVTWNTPASAAPAEIAAPAFSPIDKLAIPAEMGSIVREHGVVSREFGGANKLIIPNSALRTVILIQDAHAVIDAQENIRKILAHLRKEYGVSLAALEGAKGRLEPVLLRTFPEAAVKRKVLAGYENRAELSGPEMESVFQENAGEFYGMEDWALYEKNYAAYLGAQEMKPELLRQWKAFKETLDLARATVYDPKLNEFQEAWEGYTSDKSSLLDLLLYLSEFSKLLKTNSEYQELPGLIASIGYEKSGKQSAIEPLVRQIADEFKTKYLRSLGVKTEMNFYKRYQSFMTGQMTAGQMLQYLVQLGAESGKRPRLTPALKLLLDHTQTLSEIKGSRLYDELRRFLPEVQASLLKTPEQRELAAKYQKLFLLKEMISLELTHEDLAQYEKDPEPYLALTGNASFKDGLVPALAFYRAALERDQAFYKNIASLMEKKRMGLGTRTSGLARTSDQGQGASDESRATNTVVVVAGGFHTNGIERILKEKGIAYAVVTPKIASLAGQENYFRVMGGDVSFKEFLKTTYFDALMRHSARALTDALPIQEQARTLKTWRDNLIRELAAEGRITDAGKYLPYIDELLKSHGEMVSVGPKRSKDEILAFVRDELERFKKDSLERIWKTFEFQLGTFTDGLKELIAKKELNTQTVSALLDRAGQSKPSFIAIQGKLEVDSWPLFEHQMLLRTPSESNIFELIPGLNPEEKELASILGDSLLPFIAASVFLSHQILSLEIPPALLRVALERLRVDHDALGNLVTELVDKSAKFLQITPQLQHRFAESLANYFYNSYFRPIQDGGIPDIHLKGVATSSVKTAHLGIGLEEGIALLSFPEKNGEMLLIDQNPFIGEILSKYRDLVSDSRKNLADHQTASLVTADISDPDFLNIVQTRDFDSIRLSRVLHEVGRTAPGADEDRSNLEHAVDVMSPQAIEARRRVYQNLASLLSDRGQVIVREARDSNDPFNFEFVKGEIAGSGVLRVIEEGSKKAERDGTLNFMITLQRSSAPTNSEVTTRHDILAPKGTPLATAKKKLGETRSENRSLEGGIGDEMPDLAIPEQEIYQLLKDRENILAVSGPGSMEGRMLAKHNILSALRVSLRPAIDAIVSRLLSGVETKDLDPEMIENFRSSLTQVFVPAVENALDSYLKANPQYATQKDAQGVDFKLQFYAKQSDPWLTVRMAGEGIPYAGAKPSAEKATDPHQFGGAGVGLESISAAATAVGFMRWNIMNRQNYLNDGIDGSVFEVGINQNVFLKTMMSAEAYAGETGDPSSTQTGLPSPSSGQVRSEAREENQTFSGDWQDIYEQQQNTPEGKLAARAMGNVLSLILAKGGVPGLISRISNKVKVALVLINGSSRTRSTDNGGSLIQLSLTPNKKTPSIYGSKGSEGGHAVHNAFGLTNTTDPNSNGYIQKGIAEAYDLLVRSLVWKAAGKEWNSGIEDEALIGEALIAFAASKGKSLEEIIELNSKDLGVSENERERYEKEKRKRAEYEKVLMEFMHYLINHHIKKAGIEKIRDILFVTAVDANYGFQHYVGAFVLSEILKVHHGDLDQVARKMVLALVHKDGVNFKEPFEFAKQLGEQQSWAETLADELKSLGARGIVSFAWAALCVYFRRWLASLLARSAEDRIMKDVKLKALDDLIKAAKQSKLSDMLEESSWQDMLRDWGIGERVADNIDAARKLAADAQLHDSLFSDIHNIYLESGNKPLIEPRGQQAEIKASTVLAFLSNPIRRGSMIGRFADRIRAELFGIRIRLARYFLSDLMISPDDISALMMLSRIGAVDLNNPSILRNSKMNPIRMLPGRIRSAWLRACVLPLGGLASAFPIWGKTLVYASITASLSAIAIQLFGVGLDMSSRNVLVRFSLSLAAVGAGFMELLQLRDHALGRLEKSIRMNLSEMDRIISDLEINPPNSARPIEELKAWYQRIEDSVHLFNELVIIEEESKIDRLREQSEVGRLGDIFYPLFRIQSRIDALKASRSLQTVEAAAAPATVRSESRVEPPKDETPGEEPNDLMGQEDLKDFKAAWERSSQGAWILIVDDSPDVSRRLKEFMILLGRGGEDVVIAGSVKEVLTILKEELGKRGRPGIVTDEQMPELDGLALIDFLTKNVKDPRILLVSSIFNKKSQWRKHGVESQLKAKYEKYGVGVCAKTDFTELKRLLKDLAPLSTATDEQMLDVVSRKKNRSELRARSVGPDFVSTLGQLAQMTPRAAVRLVNASGLRGLKREATQTAESRRVELEAQFGESVNKLDEILRGKTAGEIQKYIESEGFMNFMKEKFGGPLKTLGFEDSEVAVEKVVRNIREFFKAVPKIGGLIGVEGLLDASVPLRRTRTQGERSIEEVSNNISAAIMTLTPREHAIDVLMNHSGSESADVLAMLERLTIERLIILHPKDKLPGRAFNRKFPKRTQIGFDYRNFASKAKQAIGVSGDGKTIAFITDKKLPIEKVGIRSVVAEIARISDPQLKALALDAIRYIFLRFAAATREEQASMMTRPDQILADLDKMGFKSVIRFKGNVMVFDMQALVDSFSARQSLEQAA